MKPHLTLLILLSLLPSGIYANEPDSVYLFSYATAKNTNRNGLQFAWSGDKKQWFPIGEDYGFLKCDYGRWGSEKKMIAPSLLQGPDGVWHCIWSLNDREPFFAHAASPDLINWGRQSYPKAPEGATVLRPTLRYADGAYLISYTTKEGKNHQITTTDFKTYTPVQEASRSRQRMNYQTVALPTGAADGQIHRVPYSVVDKLIKSYERKKYKNSLTAESFQQDSQRFAGLAPIKASIALQPEAAKPISDLLLGIFFEDINYAADGGLYAELIQNRDFEYTLGDKEGRDTTWKNTHSWSLKGANARFSIDTAKPLHPNNPHYAVLQVQKPGAALANGGYDGIPLKKGEAYRFSMLAKQLKGKDGKLKLNLVSKDGITLATAVLTASSPDWKIATATLTPNADASDAHLELEPTAAGDWALDMVSLFPQKTFKDRKNGLRSDLAQTIADIHPRFVRFPGGCVAHGDGLSNIYRWKNTIGPLEARKPARNLWGYHQSMGLGFFEYFQFCEDIGAQPLPVVAAGVPCQNSASSPTGGGQQGGIPMSEMDEYVQDILDLVEYANGPVTSTWGRRRAEAGHSKPFNLKYIGVGNEDLVSDVFEERFKLIYHALKKSHPEITVIGTAGPFYEGTDYEEGWKLAAKEDIPMLDEHYYNAPGWFINNSDFYDRYDRSKAKVYLGEYASRGSQFYNALAEALYLTALERNGDVVTMASYAPLLAKQGHTQWNPDLIYFGNTEIKTTPSYEVQKLYGNYGGSEYLPQTIELSGKQEAVQKRIAVSAVRDSKTKDVIIKLANLLPVSVTTDIDLNGIVLAGKEAEKIVLQGKPGDKTVTPVKTSFNTAAGLNMDLPPYSFTVIRMKGK